MASLYSVQRRNDNAKVAKEFVIPRNCREIFPVLRSRALHKPSRWPAPVRRRQLPKPHGRVDRHRKFRLLQVRLMR
jgi:hypothetical protein